MHMWKFLWVEKSAHKIFTHCKEYMKEKIWWTFDKNFSGHWGDVSQATITLNLPLRTVILYITGIIAINSFDLNNKKCLFLYMRWLPRLVYSHSICYLNYACSPAPMENESKRPGESIQLSCLMPVGGEQNSFQPSVWWRYKNITGKWRLLKYIKCEKNLINGHRLVWNQR